MKRIISVLAIGLMSGWTAAAQTTASAQSAAQVSGSSSGAASSTTSSSANGASNSLTLPAGTKIDASLATSLDAKRSRAGDDVEVRTEEDIKQDGKVVLKKGTHLVGHVALAQPKANGQTQSQLGIVFDYAVLKNGQQVPFNAAIQAMASARPAMEAPAAADDSLSSGGGMGAERGTARVGGLAGSVAATTNATAGAATGTVMNTAASAPVYGSGSMNSATRSSGAVGGRTSTGRLASNSSGVFGLDGLSIDAAASTATQGSMIVSSTKNVHLDSGTQLLLSTKAQAQ